MHIGSVFCCRFIDEMKLKILLYGVLSHEDLFEACERHLIIFQSYLPGPAVRGTIMLTFLYSPTQKLSYELGVMKYNLFVSLPFRLDKYKPDPSDAAGARPEQLSDSDGRPAHRGPLSDEHGGPRGAD